MLLHNYYVNDASPCIYGCNNNILYCIAVSQILVCGVQIKKVGKHFEDGRIKLLDTLYKICDREAAAMSVKELEETVIAPRTKICMQLDGTFAVTADLKPFLKTGLIISQLTASSVQYIFTCHYITPAKKHHATHIFALRPTSDERGQQHYGLTIKKDGCGKVQ